MHYSILLNEAEGVLQYGQLVWTFAGIFAAVVVVGWVAKAMGWLYVEKQPAPAKKKAGH